MPLRRREQVRLESRRHGVVLVPPLVASLAAAALGGAVLALGWPFSLLGALALALGAFVALRAVWRWDRTRLVVTDETLLLVRGTLRRRTASVSLRTLPWVELEQTLPGRLLGYGTVVAGSLEIDHVPRPEHVCTLVERLAA